MKKIKTSHGAIIFVFLFICFMIYHNIQKPRLLILHSYDESYAWVKDVNMGLKRILKSDGHRYFIRWYYLDTKRHPSISYKKQMGTLARRMIEDWHPNIVIAMDDDAQEYVAKYYKNDPWISIIFGGVNNTLETYGYDQAENVTGILERIPLDVVKESLETFSAKRNEKNPLRVFFIGDTSETVKGDEQWLKKYSWEPIQLVDTKLVDTLDDWKSSVVQASKIADYILVSNYRKIYRSEGNDELVPPKELINTTLSLAMIPVIGTNAFFAEDGGMIAIATSPLEQGETTGTMAVEMLEKGMKANHIPIVTSTRAVVAMRETGRQQIKMIIPKIYEACARAGNYYYK